MSISRPEGVTPKRMAIIHLFGGGFFGGNKNAGYIINDAKALGARGYTNISANYRLQSQGLWPAQIHDVKAAIRWTRANAGRLGIEAEQDRRRGLLRRRHARTDGGRHERQAGVRRQRAARRASARRSTRRIGVYPLASAQIARGLFAEGESDARGHCGRVADDLHRPELRADDLHSRHGRHDGVARSRASTSSPSFTRRTCRRR